MNCNEEQGKDVKHSKSVIKKYSKGFFFSNPTLKIRSDCIAQGIGCCSI